MITTINLVNNLTVIIFFLKMGTFKIYSLRNFQIYALVWLTIISMLYITYQNLSHFFLLYLFYLNCFDTSRVTLVKLRGKCLNLSFSAKNRGIAIPVDLDSQVNTLFLKSHSNMVQRAAMGWRLSARSGPRFKEALGGPSWDYRNIIEKLQVQ